MWLKNFSIAAGAALLGVASAHATVDRGWYVGLEAGWNGLQDTDVVADPNVGNTFDGSASFDGGFAALMTGGYAFTPNWRAELELGYRSNDIDSLCSGGGCVPSAGGIEQFTQMLNVIYDWRIADKWSIATGLGAGGDYVELNSVFGNDNDYVFAYQAIVGLNYHLSDRMDVVLNYRYLHTENPEFLTTNVNFVDFQINSDDLENHTVTVGLRWDLHPMAAPPVVIQPPMPREPAKQYIVFFGFNKSNLTSEAQAVVAEAAAAAKQMGTATILVTGHTDTVGGNAYNNRLSQRRADVVRGELERLGVKSKIIATGKGETELLVQTADNVKEPQNRRATIDLQ